MQMAYIPALLVKNGPVSHGPLEEANATWSG